MSDTNIDYNNIKINIKDKKLKNESPLRYPGGKTRACKILDKIINEYYDINEFEKLVSPFFGGGSFEFYFQNNYEKLIIANDKFKPLYHFWIQVKNNKKKLCDELNKIKESNSISKDDFINYKKKIFHLDDNILEQSICFFVINRCSFNGSTLSGGFSKDASCKRFTKSSINKINNLNLSNIDFHNLDFNNFFEMKGINDKSLFFIDPPYYLEEKSKLYGKNGDLHENFNHEDLFHLIIKQNNWIITYNNCDYIKNMYKDYIIIDVEWSYGMNKNKKSSEIVILSKLKNIG
jgi:DNA adenine methylase